jgi:hypothetical protein
MSFERCREDITDILQGSHGWGRDRIALEINRLPYTVYANPDHIMLHFNYFAIH